MKFIHPHTQNIFICSDQCDLTAEIDTRFENAKSVIIGDLGYGSSLRFCKDEWTGFVALVKLVDEVWGEL